ADSNLPLCVHVPSSSEELSPELIGVSAWDLNHNRGLAPLSNHFKAALDLEGLEVGNAWALRSPEAPHTNWVVGDHPAIPANSLRFLRHGDHPDGVQGVKDLALKWFAHSPADPPQWGESKPLSTGRTLSLLAGKGAFALWFWRGDQEARVLLEEPGDFTLWGAGLGHRWRVIQPSLLMTLRWRVEE
ncbi:MAG: hypothetical protein ACK6BC_03705, partial [Cyanobacteriota bacterium]